MLNNSALFLATSSSEFPKLVKYIPVLPGAGVVSESFVYILVAVVALIWLSVLILLRYQNDSQISSLINRFGPTNNDDIIECDEDENLNEHNTAFVLDSSQIDWEDPRNDAYYDPHDDCEEYPGLLHNHGYSYGSNYDGGYDSY